MRNINKQRLAFGKCLVLVMIWAQLSPVALASTGDGSGSKKKPTYGWEYVGMAITSDSKVLCKDAKSCAELVKKSELKTTDGKPLQVSAVTKRVEISNQSACFDPVSGTACLVALACAASGGLMYQGTRGMIRDRQFSLSDGAMVGGGAAVASGGTAVATLAAADIFLMSGLAAPLGVGALLCGGVASLGAGAVHIFHLWWNRHDAVQKK